MAATVQFDCAFCGGTVEIQDLTVQRMLTPKFVSLQNFEFANAAKECAQYQLLFSATNGRDS